MAKASVHMMISLLGNTSIANAPVARGAVKRLLLLMVAAVASACGGGQPPLSNLTSLSCPYPGPLPFHLQSYGFVSAVNEKLAHDETRSKDEASDTIGNPEGAIANVFMPDDAMPAPAAIDYRGVKARTAENQGLFADPLPGENVSLWSYDGAAWHSLGRAQTDADGTYDLPGTGFAADAGAPLYAVLEADGSCAAHYDYLLPSGTKFVVFDIDGTLTTSDGELLTQLSDSTYTPMMMTAANTMVQAWAAKGYTIVYLTARTHNLRAETRAWLDQLGFPKGAVITTNSTNDAQAYKTLWLERMIDDFGWVAVAAYGNAETDIGAYAAAGIPTDVTFIIGPYGGESGTVAIGGNDYTDNIANFVSAQPDVQAKKASHTW